MAPAYNLSTILQFAVQIAKEAGAEIKAAGDKRWTTPSSGAKDSKGPEEKLNSVDLVTETDQAVEKLVFDRIRKKFPDHICIGEESAAAGASKEITDAPTWIVDPVDGTTNFVHGFPFVCVSIGFCVNKEPSVGVIYNPFLDALYQGHKGGGSFYNGQRLPFASPHPQPLRSWGEALVGTEWGAVRSADVTDKKASSFRRLVADGQEVPGALMVRSLRSIGSAALNFCHVATGQVDYYWEIGCYSWDVCAGVVIAREAGCKVWGKDGKVLDAEGLSARHYHVMRAIGEGPEGKKGEAAQDHLFGIMQNTLSTWEA